jgi:hypothetical protein
LTLDFRLFFVFDVVLEHSGEADRSYLSGLFSVYTPMSRRPADRHTRPLKAGWAYKWPRNSSEICPTLRKSTPHGIVHSHQRRRGFLPMQTYLRSEGHLLVIYVFSSWNAAPTTGNKANYHVSELSYHLSRPTHPDRRLRCFCSGFSHQSFESLNAHPASCGQLESLHKS